MDWKKEYLKFCLRLDKHLKPLLKHYFGPSSLKGTIEKEKVIPLNELKNHCLALRKELKEPSISNQYFRKFLLSQLKCYEVIIRDRLGEKISHREYIKHAYGIEAQKIDEEEINFYHKKLEILLKKRGYLGHVSKMLYSWFSDQRLEGERMLKVFRNEIKKAKKKTTKFIKLPILTPEVKVKGTKNVPYRMQANILIGKPEINVNLAYKISSQDLKVLACHEVYPGHYTHFCFLEKLYFENPNFLECSYFSTFTPFLPIIEGIGESAYFFIYGTPKDIDEQITCLLNDLVKLCFVNSDLFYWGEGKPEEKVAEFLKTKAFFPPENVSNKLKWIKNEGLKGYDSVYWYGGKLIKNYFRKAKEVGKVEDFFQIIYKEVLTPEILNIRMGKSGINIF